MFGYQYIVNPMTNRRVSVHTKIGHKVINNFLKVRQLAGSMDESRLEMLKQRAQLRTPAPLPYKHLMLKKRAGERSYKAPRPPIKAPVKAPIPRPVDQNQRQKPARTVKRNTLVAIPKHSVKPNHKLIREVTTKSKGTTDRLTAGEYYRSGGKKGDICDIRGDGELRCLVIGKNDTPSWKKLSQNEKTLTYQTCGLGPWKEKCTVKIQKK